MVQTSRQLAIKLRIFHPRSSAFYGGGGRDVRPGISGVRAVCLSGCVCLGDVFPLFGVLVRRELAIHYCFDTPLHSAARLVTVRRGGNPVAFENSGESAGSCRNTTSRPIRLPRLN